MNTLDDSPLSTRLERAAAALPHAMEDAEERFRTMADHAPVLLWMTSTEGLCEFFNQGWIRFTGRPMEAELGNGWAEGVHPEDFQHCMHVFMSAFVKREAFSMEYRLRRHDGEYRWILDQGAPRFGTGGHFAGFIGSCVDITVQREAQHALEALNRELEQRVQERTELASAKETLLREVHHRVKNDIQLTASLLRMHEREVVDPAAKETLDECESRIHAIARVHEHMYDSSDLARMSFSTHVREIAEALVGRRSTRVALELDLEEIPITVDKAIHCSMILHELIVNALRHGFPPGRSGSLWVSCRRQGSRQLRLSVRDDGVGLPADFDPQQHARIGWMLIRNFAKQLRGELTFSSDAHTSVTLTIDTGLRDGSTEP
jgi:PAS domain S-box-containing protein